MSTPRTEGFSAGYKNLPPSANPYLKGLAAPTATLSWAMEWVAGYVAGIQQAHDDLIDKHREGTR